MSAMHGGLAGKAEAKSVPAALDRTIRSQADVVAA